MQKLAWTAYNKSSRFYFDQYNSLRFSQVHRTFAKFLPTPGSKILDIGSGSGRDAFALAKKGYQVTGVEPSIAMLKLAKKYHDHERITWIQDSLPKLSKLTESNTKFDFILLSAVWMHIKPANRLSTLKRLNSLLSADGLIAVTLRIGPTIAERSIYEVTVDDLILKADKANMHPIFTSRLTKDSLNRSDVSWKKIVLANNSSQT